MLEKSAISHQPHSCSEVSAARKTSSTAASFSLTLWTQFGVKRSNHPSLGYPMTHKNGGSLRNRMLNCQENNTYASLSQHHKIYQLVHIYVHSTSTPPPATKQPTTSPYGTRLVGLSRSRKRRSTMEYSPGIKYNMGLENHFLADDFPFPTGWMFLCQAEFTMNYQRV
jgi:hypothetical protein